MKSYNFYFAFLLKQKMIMRKRVANLKIEECFRINGLLTRVELRQNCGIDLTLTGLYANFGRAVTHFVNRLSINRLNDGSTVKLRETLKLKKLGSENSNAYGKKT
jgi:hypothetical protein